MRRGRIARAIAVVALGAVPVAAGCADADDGPLAVEDGAAATPDLRFTIPLGAGEAAGRGRPLAILPAVLEVEVGDVIEIVNDDELGQLVGPFYVGAGEVLRQRFTSPGRFEGMCGVHPSGRIEVVVV